MPIQHKHLIVRAEIEQPPTSEETCSQWFKELIEKINMKILAGPFCVYLDKEGNRGLTGVCIIETSHIAVHFWDEDSPGLMQLDVYTCSELKLEIVFDHIQIYKPTKIEYKFIDRENDLTLIEES